MVNVLSSKNVWTLESFALLKARSSLLHNGLGEIAVKTEKKYVGTARISYHLQFSDVLGLSISV